MVRKEVKPHDISYWLNRYTIEELQKMGKWISLDMYDTKTFNALRLKRKGLNSLELTIPLDILQNPNFKFDGWQKGVFIHFFVIDTNKILLVLDGQEWIKEGS
jgi:hypothetical protein